MSSSLNVVFVYAFDETQSTMARVDQVKAMVQKKLPAQFPGSCISSVYAHAYNKYSTEKMELAGDGSINIYRRSYTTTRCYENMASGLLEAHMLIMIGHSHPKNPRGIILLFSDASTSTKGCFFDKAEDFVSKFPVHTFTLGSDGHNPGLCNIAANSPGGTFNSIPIPYKQEKSLPLSLLLDGIISGSIKDDEKPPTGTGSNKGLVSIKEVKYLKDDAVLTTGTTVTAEVEIRATSSAAAVREGLDLVAVLDVSCRKDKAKIDNLKNAMKLVILMLTPMDRLSIVTFCDGAARLTPLRCMTPAAQKELIAIIDGLSVSARSSGGGTNIKAGLDTGLAVIAGRVNTTARTANVFLVSYGKQTVGDARVVDPGEVAAAVYTFGAGGDSDHHRLLSDLAAKSRGGMFSAVSSDGENDLSVALSQSQLLAGLHTAVVPQDVQLTLTPKPKTADVVADATSSVVASGTDDDYGTHSVDDDGGTGAITISLGTLFAAGVGRKVVITLGGVEDGRTATHE